MPTILSSEQITYSAGFNPNEVFDQLYSNHLLRGLYGSEPTESLGRCWVERIREEFASLGDQLVGCPSRVLHSRNMRRTRLLERIKSSVSCSACLFHPPEQFFNCGHGLCDSCVRVFGEAIFGREECYWFASCLSCEDNLPLSVKQKPPTAGVRIITIDGGGIYGVIPLEVMNLLQRLIGPVPIQSFFDEAFGTSSGKSKQMNVGLLTDVQAA